MKDVGDRQASTLIVAGGRGEVSNDATVPSALCDRLHEMIDRGERSIFLDVSQITYADSMLLGVLAQGYVSALRRGATVTLLHVTERLRKVLALTKLDKILQTSERQEPVERRGS